MAMYFDPFTELNRVTSGVLQDRFAPRSIPVDLYREQEQYVLNADMPGVDPGSIDVDIDGQLLTLRAHRTSDTAEGVKWLSRERPGGSYLRQFSVGEGVDTERISASYENGVLSVILPLSERAKPRKVAVESTPRSADASIVA